MGQALGHSPFSAWSLGLGWAVFYPRIGIRSLCLGLKSLVFENINWTRTWWPCPKGSVPFGESDEIQGVLLCLTKDTFKGLVVPRDEDALLFCSP